MRLRISDCLWCGKPLPDAITKPRSYCSDSHRTLAYQRRKREAAIRKTLDAIAEIEAVNVRKEAA